jgi:DNA-binding transcriptional MerR regulator
MAEELTGLSQRQLRILESKGIVTCTRTASGRRLYSIEQVRKLKYVSYLVRVRGANVAGVTVALELLDRLPPPEQERVLEEAEDARQALGSDAGLDHFSHDATSPEAATPQMAESPQEAPPDDRQIGKH